MKWKKKEPQEDTVEVNDYHDDDNEEKKQKTLWESREQRSYCPSCLLNNKK